MKSLLRQRLLSAAFRIFDFFASLELAVFLILATAAALAAGTIYESKYSAAIASREVYRALWMQILLWAFMLNLAAAALSRLPWRRPHIGFVITHIGIITLLLGSWVTQRAGVDGNLVLAPGEQGRSARIDENRLYVFQAISGKAYDLVLNERLDFDQRKASDNPAAFKLRGSNQELKILRYLPKAQRETRAEDVPANQGGMPGLKFQMSGSRATFSDWLFLQADTGSTREVGPAVFRFVGKKPDLSGKPERATVVLYMEGDSKLPPKLAVARAGNPYRELGRIALNKPMNLGWMDFQFVLEEFHPSALPKAEYHEMVGSARPEEGQEVIQVGFGGQNLWLELGSSGQVPVGDSLYYVQFTRREVDLGFDLKLTDFRIGYYEGTQKPKTYESDVEVAGVKHTISMNEPLVHGGYTFYQASYEVDSEGKPRYSVLSVNLDPGRKIKYLGSLMMVLGIILMFYFKPIYSGRSRWLAKKEEK